MKEEVECFLSLGSNLGDRLRYLDEGVKALGSLEKSKLLRVSSIYETEPVDYKDQPQFLNLAAGIETSIEPLDLLDRIKAIEEIMGRKHRDRWREREIDIDIIFFGNETLNTNNLEVPHPRAYLRRFVLQPLSEIAGDFVHPRLHESVNNLLRHCGDNSRVERLSYTLHAEAHD